MDSAVVTVLLSAIMLGCIVALPVVDPVSHQSAGSEGEAEPRRVPLGRTLCSGIAVAANRISLVLIYALLCYLGDWLFHIIHARANGPLLLLLAAGIILYSTGRISVSLTGKERRLDRGELVDRVRELAGRAGVNVSAVFIRDPVVPGCINASVDVWGALDLSTPLVKDLACDEVDAVIAREIGHLQLDHLSSMLSAVFGGLGAWLFCCYGIASVFPWGYWRFVLYGGCWLGMITLVRILSDRQAIEADAVGVWLTGNAMAHLNSLLRTMDRRRRSGRRQQDRPWLSGFTRRRLCALARRAGIPDEDHAEVFRKILDTPESGELPENRYEIRAEDGASRVFTQRLWMARSASYVGSARVAACLVCYAIFVILHGVFPHSGFLAEFGIVAVSMAGFYGFLVLVRSRISGAATLRVRKDIRSRVESRYQISVGSAPHVGYSPGRVPCTYGGESCWDAGFLFWESGRMLYLGDGWAFEIQPDHVVGVEAPNPRSEATGRIYPRVVVTWRVSGAPKQAFALEVRDARSLREAHRLTAALVDDIELWRLGLKGLEIPPLSVTDCRYRLPIDPDSVIGAPVPVRGRCWQQARAIAYAASFIGSFGVALALDRTLPANPTDSPILMLGALLIAFAGAIWLQPILRRALDRTCRPRLWETWDPGL